MNGSAEINQDELLDTLEQMTSTQFKKFIFQLGVPLNLIPSLEKPQTDIALDVLLLAKAPGGCGLDKIKQTLEEMRIPLGKSKTSKDLNEIYQIVKDRLFNFDHKKTLEIFQKIVEQLARKEHAGIFILPKCLSQGGKYCHKRLINYLKDPSVTAQGKFHLKNVNYISGELTLKGLLCRLGSELGIKDNLKESTEQIIAEEIVKKLKNLIPKNDAGHTYLFHIKGYDRLFKDRIFWKLLLEDFWNILIKNLPSIVKSHRRLKLIFLFESMINIEVNPDYLYCFSTTLTSKKIIELPLNPCALEEIDAWLCDCSKLPLERINNIINILEDADDKDRQPDRVYNYLEDELTQYYLQQG